MKKAVNFTFAGIAAAVFLGGCATNDQGQLVIDQGKVRAVIVAINPPPPPPPPMVIEEAYQPMPTDVYVATVVDADVVVVGGNTYIWVVGPEGARHRRFYAHGDRREEVFHRREDLHRVAMNHGGHLPERDFARGTDHPGEMPHPGGIAQGHPAPGVSPVAHAALQNKPAAPTPKPTAKDVKKT